MTVTLVASPSDRTKLAGLVALQTDITALAALSQTPANAQLLKQKQQSLVQGCMDIGAVPAADIISAFPLKFTSTYLAAKAPRIAILVASIAAQPQLVGPLKNELKVAQQQAVDDAMVAGLISASEVLALLIAPYTLAGFATATGTTGQVSFTASSFPVLAGQKVTLSGTKGGTGAITGYVNPTTYLVGATNGSTTATLTNTDGSAIATTAGSITGLTVTVHSP